MVRNVASMQSLQGNSFEHHTLPPQTSSCRTVQKLARMSAPGSTFSTLCQDPECPHYPGMVSGNTICRNPQCQPCVNAKPAPNMGQRHVQMSGQDDQTKALMQKVATGQASEAERTMFEQQVTQAGSSSNLRHTFSFPSPLQSEFQATPQPPQAPMFSPLALERSRALLRAHYIDPETVPPHQLAELCSKPVEEQIKAVEHIQTMRVIEAQQPPPPPAPVGQSTGTWTGQVRVPEPFQMSPEQRQEYQMQLMLLEQQNRERLQETRPVQCQFRDASGRTVTRTAPVQQQPGAAPTRASHNNGTGLAATHAADVQRTASVQQQPGAATARASQNNGTGLAATYAANLNAERFPQATRKNAEKYAKPFCDFLTDNPTVFHAVAAMKKQLKDEGFSELLESDEWKLQKGGKYYVHRNGSSLMAFVVGEKYVPGNGAAILAGHVDALTAKLKPISKVPNSAGYLQLGIAPYAGAPNMTWWDRDLGIGGRVLVQEDGKIVEKLVKLDWPIARIPTLAPHFGAPAYGPFNPETQMVPIIGLEDTTTSEPDQQMTDAFSQPPLLGQRKGDYDTFQSTQPPALVRAIGEALGMGMHTAKIVNWELELFDIQPATLGGLNKEFIYAGRIDDKLCSWAALQALIEGSKSDTEHSSLIKMVALFDDEEIGSLLRQGARGNLLPMTMSRAVNALAGDRGYSPDLLGRTFANSFLVSSDVTHAVNPNFLASYLPNHSPHLNVGVVVSADSNGHMTTDAVSTAMLKRCADKVGARLQVCFPSKRPSGTGRW